MAVGHWTGSTWCCTIRGMRSPKPLIPCLALLLSACFYNPTIEEEIAGKCSISVSEYQKAEDDLAAGQNGMSIHAGRCRLTRTSKGVTEGTVIDGSR